MWNKDPDKQIDFFDGTDFDFLSNFHPSEVRLGDIKCATVEHAYQAAKTFDPAKRLLIATCKLPGTAKYLGRHVPLREDWEDVKETVMEALLLQKFAEGSPLGEKLLKTGDAVLIEGNTWGDRYWGMTLSRGGRLVGRNRLGHLLTHVRTLLQRKRADYFTQESLSDA